MQLELVSFNEDDLDYEGYEFSVTGKLSEVRLVFLNRFIQEVSFGKSPSEHAVSLFEILAVGWKVIPSRANHKTRSQNEDLSRHVLLV